MRTLTCPQPRPVLPAASTSRCLRALALMLALACQPAADAADAVPVRVNDQAFTAEDVDAEAAYNKAQPRPALKPKDATTSLIERALLAQAAAQAGLLERFYVLEEVNKALPFPLEKAYLPGTATPTVMTGKERANTTAARAALARIYIDVRAAALPPISDAEIHAFYVDNPLLFANRHLYTMKEITVEQPTPQVEALIEAHTKTARSIEALALALKARKAVIHGGKGIRGAEQLPLDMLEFVSRMKLGVAYKSPNSNAAQLYIYSVESVKREPVDEPAASPAIERFLTNKRIAALAESETSALREKAFISPSDTSRQ